MTSAITISDLTVRYADRNILSQCSLCIPERTLSVILGRNGSGKSTLVKTLAGLVPVTGGTIELFGSRFDSEDVRGRSSIVGYLGQQSKQVFPYTVEEYVLTGRVRAITFVPSLHDLQLVCAALDRVGISDLKDRMITELSGGELQLVRIARLLVHETPVMLLDEPITHLDVAHQVHIMRLLKEFVQEGKTVVTVLHDPNLAIMFGEKFIVVRNGLVETIGSVEQLRTSAFLESVYGCPFTIVEGNGITAVLPTDQSRGTPYGQ